jgi:dTDP-4-amino-4,6-dideoxygalactose transaminase
MASGLVLAKAAGSELLSSPWIYWLPNLIPWLRLGETVYHPAGAPRSITPTSASLLIEAIDREAEEVAGRRLVESRYADGLAHVSEVKLGRPAAEMRSGALRFPIRIPPEAGVALGILGVVRSYPRTLAHYPELAAHIEAVAAPLPGAAALAGTLHTLPTHARMDGHDVDRLIDHLSSLR